MNNFDKKALRANALPVNLAQSHSYGGLKKKCIFRLAKGKLKMEKKMTLPILPTPLCCH